MWPLRLTPPWRLVQCLRYDVTGWSWILERDGDVVSIDTLDDPEGVGEYGFRTGSAIRAEPEALDAIRAAYLTAKGLRQGITEAHQWQQIRALSATDRDRFLHELAGTFGADIVGELASAVDRGAAPEADLWRRARAQSRRRRLGGPARAARLARRSLERIIGGVLRPTGFTVVIAGPDGTGKSTLAERLPKVCEGPFRRNVHLHWRPGILPSPGHIAATPRSDPTDPHGRTPHGSVLSIAVLGYYWIDFLLGNWLRIAPTRSRSGLVVIERGWWDIAVDPRRYRMRVSPSLVRFLGRLLPRPDLVLVLDAPGRIMAERKGEISDDEARRQSEAWRGALPSRVDRTFVDATPSSDEVAAGARNAIFDRLSKRTTQRLGAGWTAMPPGSRRWLFPRGPRKAAETALSIFQPVTARGRVGWEVARFAARAGAFRLAPRAEAPPRSVCEKVAPYVPPRSTLATMRATHPHRHVVSVIDEQGRPRAIAKVALDDEGRANLRAEAEALRRLGPCVKPPVHPPRLIAQGDGVLVLEAVQWRPRRRPWVLPIDVARASGELFRRTASSDGERGGAHGDLAPWNVLLTDGGWTLVDWENASEEAPPFTDVLHFLVQAHALLGRPSQRDLIASVATGRGSGGAAIQVYGLAAGASAGIAFDVFREYLERTLPTLDPNTRDGRRGIRARRSLLTALESGAGAMRQQGS